VKGASLNAVESVMSWLCFQGVENHGLKTTYSMARHFYHITIPGHFCRIHLFIHKEVNRDTLTFKIEITR
jgi:hypothetical protein